MPQISEKQYKILGRLYVKKHPEEAEEILSAYTNIPATEHEYNRIEKHFTRFCLVNGLKEEQYTGPLYKSDKVEIRRVFVAVMVHLYHPSVFQIPIEDISIPVGFVKTLSRVTGQKTANVCTMIRDVARWETHYDDFKQKVQDQLKNFAG
jgi:hypothetical protein